MRTSVSYSNTMRWASQSTGTRIVTYSQGILTSLAQGAVEEVINQGGDPASHSNDKEMQQSIALETRPADTWIGILRGSLYEVDGVESIFVAKHENTFDVWVIIADRDLQVVRNISNAERALLKLFLAREHNPIFSFDFHTLYRGVRKATELVPKNALPLPRLQQ